MTRPAYEKLGCDELERLVSEGDPEAQYQLGWRLHNGRGVEADLVRAHALYAAASAQGHVWATTNLGSLYQSGHGVERDLKRALVLYQSSARKGDSLAQNNLGLMFVDGEGTKKDLTKGTAWLRRSARGGEARGQANYADSLKLGRGCLKNKRAAARWYRMAAAQGIVTAIDDLGECYRDGVGVKESAVEAVALFRLAAERGNASAQTSLANQLIRGSGTVADRTNALEWYRRAFAQGDYRAQYFIVHYFHGDSDCSKDVEEALAEIKARAEKGDSAGQYSLGCLLQYGEGVSQNLDAAEEFYRKSISQGNKSAEENLFQLQLEKRTRKVGILRASLSYFTWYPALLLCLGGLSLIDLLERALSHHLDWTWPFETVLNNYRRVVALIGEVAEPPAQTIIDLLHRFWGFDLHLSLDWRQVFIATLIPILATVRTAFTIFLDMSRLRSPIERLRRLSPLFWLFGSVTAGALLGSLASGLLSGDWWLTVGVRAALPMLGVAATTPIYYRHWQGVASIAALAVIPFVISALLALLNVHGALLLGVLCSSLLAGAALLAAGIIQWRRREDVGPCMTLVRSGLICVGALPAAGLYLLSNWLVLAASRP